MKWILAFLISFIVFLPKILFAQARSFVMADSSVSSSSSGSAVPENFMFSCVGAQFLNLVKSDSDDNSFKFKTNKNKKINIGNGGYYSKNDEYMIGTARFSIEGAEPFVEFTKFETRSVSDLTSYKYDSDKQVFHSVRSEGLEFTLIPKSDNVITKIEVDLPSNNDENVVSFMTVYFKDQETPQKFTSWCKPGK